jgi:hypothetical protein
LTYNTFRLVCFLVCLTMTAAGTVVCFFLPLNSWGPGLLISGSLLCILLGLTPTSGGSKRKPLE